MLIFNLVPMGPTPSDAPKTVFGIEREAVLRMLDTGEAYTMRIAAPLPAGEALVMLADSAEDLLDQLVSEGLKVQHLVNPEAYRQAPWEKKGTDDA